MTLLISWMILAFAVWATAALLPGIQLHGAANAMVVAAILGILNLCIGWVLFAVIGVATLGIGFLLAFATRWVVDALLLKFTAALTDRIRVASFGWAFLGGMFMSAIGTVAQWVIFGHAV